MAHLSKHSNAPERRIARRGLGKISIILGLAILTAGGLVAYGVFGRPDTVVVERPLTKVVSKGPFEYVVTEQGEIESSSNVEIRCEVKSRGTSGITIIDVVAEGTVVQEGDILVKLDATALEQEKIQQLIACNSAEALAIQSQNTFEAAKIAKTEYLEGTFKQEELLILSEVFVAEQALTTAQLAARSAERLALRGQVTDLQLQAEEFAADKARKDLEAAQTKLNVLRKYTKQKMLKTLDSDIASAEAKWKSDQRSNELEQAKLRDIEDQITKCTIRAPRAGQVVYANKYDRGRSGATAEFVVEPGAVLREQQPIIRLPDPTQMQVRASINESRVNSVLAGMPVAIRVEALREDLLQGEIIKVNQYADPGGWGTTVKKYATFVRIIDPPEELRAGMNAEVRIFVERQPDALQVPVQAIAEHKDHFFCLVETEEGLVTKEIQRGPANDKFMVVLDGVNEGDHVVLDPRSRKELTLPDLPDPTPVAKTIKPPTTSPVALTTGGLPGATKLGPPGSPKGGPPGGGPPGNGPPGGRGGFSPAVLVSRTFEEFDANKDQKLQADEVAAMPEDRRSRMPADADANKDGDLDRAELTEAISKRFRDRQQAGGPPSPASGAGQ